MLRLLDELITLLCQLSELFNKLLRIRQFLFENLELIEFFLCRFDFRLKRIRLRLQFG